eukprot:Clim_evm20s156 gene=Clim_evmTU20s156
MAGKGVDLMQLAIPQLQQLRQQFDQELQYLQQSEGQLQSIAARLQHAKQSINFIKDKPNGSESLIPLTSSIYINGKIKDTSKVTVELGTGYYLEKSLSDATEFYTRRLDYLKQQIEMIAKTINQKGEQITVVNQVLQEKAAAMQQQQQQQPAQ